jgi:hypothetical protein
MYEAVENAQKDENVNEKVDKKVLKTTFRSYRKYRGG